MGGVVGWVLSLVLYVPASREWYLDPGASIAGQRSGAMPLWQAVHVYSIHEAGQARLVLDS